MIKKYNLKLILIITILGLMLVIPVNNVEANDTRNRVLTFHLYKGIELPGGETTGYKDWNNKKLDEKVNIKPTLYNQNIYVEATTSGIRVQGDIVINDYYPAYDSSSPVLTMLTKEGYINPRPVVDLVSFGGNQYITKITFPHLITSQQIRHIAGPGATAKVFSANTLIDLEKHTVNDIIGYPAHNQNTPSPRQDYTVYPFYEVGNKRMGITQGHSLIPTDNWQAMVSGFLGYLKMTIAIPADDPSITVSNITTSKATISWNTNNINPEGTNYTLQYRRLTGIDPSIEGHWGGWTVIPVANQNTTTALTTTAEIFQPDNTYQLRVQVNHIGGSQYNVYSDYVMFSTSADPAVRAAQEAAIASQAAKKAAEDSVSYSLDAKQSADFVKSEIEHPEYGLQALANQIKNTTPFIQKISHPQEATITFKQSFELVINATGVPAYMRYRVICEDFDSGWVTNNRITITGIHEEGLKKASVMVSNNPVDPDNGIIAKDEFNFFKASF